MKKKLSSKSSKEIKKDYQKIIKDYIPFHENLNYQEWKTNDDVFKKFSLYKETRSGVTSINTSIIANP